PPGVGTGRITRHFPHCGDLFSRGIVRLWNSATQGSSTAALGSGSLAEDGLVDPRGVVEIAADLDPAVLAVEVVRFLVSLETLQRQLLVAPKEDSLHVFE